MPCSSHSANVASRERSLSLDTAKRTSSIACDCSIAGKSSSFRTSYSRSSLTTVPSCSPQSRIASSRTPWRSEASSTRAMSKALSPSPTTTTDVMGPQHSAKASPEPLRKEPLRELQHREVTEEERQEESAYGHLEVQKVQECEKGGRRDQRLLEGFADGFRAAGLVEPGIDARSAPGCHDGYRRGDQDKGLRGRVQLKLPHRQGRAGPVGSCERDGGKDCVGRGEKQDRALLVALEQAGPSTYQRRTGSRPAVHNTEMDKKPATGTAPERMQPDKVRVVRQEDYREEYANSVQVNVSIWDFFLQFGRLKVGGANDVTFSSFQGVYMSPQQAKALHLVLAQNIAQYESTFWRDPHRQPQGHAREPGRLGAVSRRRDRRTGQAESSSAARAFSRNGSPASSSALRRASGESKSRRWASRYRRKSRGATTLLGSTPSLWMALPSGP